MTDAATPTTAAGRAEQLDRLVRDTLGAESSAQWRTGAADRSFIALGGDSLGAVTLVAQAEELLGVSIDFARLLGLDPLAEVLDAAVAAKPAPARAEPPRAAPGPGLRPVLPGQESMLLTQQFVGGSALHMMVTAELTGPLDDTALTTTLDRLVARHEELRTVYVAEHGRHWRRVLPARRAPLTRMALSLAEGDDAVDLVHAQLTSVSEGFLAPLERPPVAFVLTELGPDRHLLTLLHHAVVADGWGVGVLWSEFAEHYRALREGGDIDDTPAPSPDVITARAEQLAASGHTAELLARRLDQLADAPKVLELPTDLVRPASFDFVGKRLYFGLGDPARQACEELCARTRLSRTVVLLAAWALALGRRAGTRDLLVGISSAERADAEIMRTLGPCSALLPVRCRLADDAPVTDYLRSTSRAVTEALAAAEVPFEDLVAGLGGMPDDRRIPLVQAVFSAHDDLVPLRLRAAELDVEIHEGHCSGTAADVSLYVQRWGERPRVSLEYATSVLTLAEATELADSFQSALVELAARAELPLAGVRALSDRQLARLAELGAGASAPSREGVWATFERAAAAHAELIAVDDPAAGLALTYQQLYDAAVAQSGRLADAGVTAGDHVVIALPRSAAEAVAVLAVLRLGAAYTALNTAYPHATLRDMLATCAPRAVLGDGEHADVLMELAPAGCARVRPVDPAGPHPRGAAPPAAPADPERVAYLTFTSGSTGRPKAVRVPQRGITRLTGDREALRTGPGERFLRLAPLSFDVSTVELFVPLATGSTVAMYPERPVSAGELADFLTERRVTVALLTAGLFRLVVEHRPDAFGTARQIMAGGDVVPPEPVRTLLRRYPGLRVSNGYGPTENTTLTTVHHIDDVCDATAPVPIGRPVAGTGVLVLDDRGGLVPPGTAGELCVSGDGLALDYLGDEERTRAAFGPVPAEDGRRVYRTGDMVRWDGAGRLRFLGRRDHQVKIRGYRIELDEVRARLAAHPAVRDSLVVTVGAGAETRRMLAAVVAGPDPELLDGIRRFMAEALPTYALPALWAVVDTLPVTPNGKVDVEALEKQAVA
ncbi:non-ribosomal peptide synthetase [Streptomyces rishiriensis]|uniref:non-ribosomal peptide synthetase n=1 Tax=Streptomyces rishiriensis TaxID=68264 RepID=UPI000D595EB7|nr:non-ribosomal peptide synthetase [Streptomyces rishiriensis]